MPLDDWSDDPPQGFWPKWFGGCVVPLSMSLYALSVLISGEGTLIGRGRIRVHGMEATIYAVLLFGLGFFLHTHFFWGNLNSLSAYSPLGKTIGLIVFVAGAGILAFRVLALM